MGTEKRIKKEKAITSRKKVKASADVIVQPAQSTVTDEDISLSRVLNIATLLPHGVGTNITNVVIGKDWFVTSHDGRLMPMLFSDVQTAADFISNGMLSAAKSVFASYNTGPDNMSFIEFIKLVQKNSTWVKVNV